jgi:hypothetical protein
MARGSSQRPASEICELMKALETFGYDMPSPPPSPTPPNLEMAHLPQTPPPHNPRGACACGITPSVNFTYGCPRCHLPTQAYQSPLSDLNEPINREQDRSPPINPAVADWGRALDDGYAETQVADDTDQSELDDDEEGEDLGDTQTDDTDNDDDAAA